MDICLHKIECLQHSTINIGFALMVVMSLLVLMLSLVISQAIQVSTCEPAHYIRAVWGYWFTYFVIDCISLVTLFLVGVAYVIRIAGVYPNCSLMQKILACYFFLVVVVVVLSFVIFGVMVREYMETDESWCFLLVLAWSVYTPVASLLTNIVGSGIFVVLATFYKVSESETEVQAMAMVENQEVVNSEDLMEGETDISEKSWWKKHMDYLGSKLPLTSLLLFLLWIIGDFICSELLHFSPSVIPFVGVITVIRVCSIDHFCSPKIDDATVFYRSISTCCIFVIQVIFFLDLYRLTRVNRIALGEIPYHKNRKVALPMVFMQTLCFGWFISYVSYGIINTCVLDVSTWYKYSTADNVTVIDPLYSVGVAIHHVDEALFKLMFANLMFSLGYGFLPSDSVGFTGWFVGSEGNFSVLPSVVYFESVEKAATQLGGFREVMQVTRLFTMQSTMTLHTSKSEPSNTLADNMIEPGTFILQDEIVNLNLANFSYFATKKDAVLEEALKIVPEKSLIFAKHVRDEKSDSHAFVFYNRSKVYITFRGTNSIPNVKTDLKFKLADWLLGSEIFEERHSFNVLSNLEKMSIRGLPCKVHKGFLLAYSEISDELHQVVEPLLLSSNNVQIRSLICTGHSLGAGQACISSFDFACLLIERCALTNLKPSVSCTTFGCPRVGTKGFVLRYSSVVQRTTRIVTQGDLITKTPPKTWGQNSYQHVGNLVILSLAGDLILEPNIGEKILINGYNTPRISRHFLSRYCLGLILWIIRVHRKPGSKLPFWKPILEHIRTFGMKDIRSIKYRSIVLEVLEKSLYFETISTQTENKVEDELEDLLMEVKSSTDPGVLKLVEYLKSRNVDS